MLPKHKLGVDAQRVLFFVNQAEPFGVGTPSEGAEVAAVGVYPGQRGAVEGNYSGYRCGQVAKNVLETLGGAQNLSNVVQ